MKNEVPYATLTRGFPTIWGVYVNYSEECTEGWEASSTIEKYDRILLQRIIPNLKHHDRRPIQSYTRKELDDLISSIRKRGQNGVENTFVPFDEKTIQSYEFVLRRIFTVAAKHYLCEDLYSKQRSIDKSKQDKNDYLPKRKTLTLEQELKIIPYIALDPQQDGELMGLYLMYIFGLRNTEACGCNFGSIVQMLIHPSCYKLRIVETTCIESNERQPSGKTANTPRYSPIIDSALSFLLARRRYVEEQMIMQGVTDVDINELPIACVGHDFQKRCSARNITDAASKMFAHLGFTHKVMCAINRQRMIENAQIAETTGAHLDLIENDLTAYILRRTYATHLAIIGMPQSKIEYLIGHMIQNPYDSRNALSHEDTLYEIKQDLEKRPIVGTNYLNNQLIQLCLSNCYDGNKTYTQTFLTPTGASCIELRFTAKEPGDTLTVTISAADANWVVQKECGIYSLKPNEYPRTVDVSKMHQKAYSQGT